MDIKTKSKGAVWLEDYLWVQIVVFGGLILIAAKIIVSNLKDWET